MKLSNYCHVCGRPLVRLPGYVRLIGAITGRRFCYTCVNGHYLIRFGRGVYLNDQPFGVYHELNDRGLTVTVVRPMGQGRSNDD